MVLVEPHVLAWVERERIRLALLRAQQSKVDDYVHSVARFCRARVNEKTGRGELFYEMNGKTLVECYEWRAGLLALSRMIEAQEIDENVDEEDDDDE